MDRSQVITQWKLAFLVALLNIISVKTRGIYWFGLMIDHSGLCQRIAISGLTVWLEKCTYIELHKIELKLQSNIYCQTKDVYIAFL